MNKILKSFKTISDNLNKTKNTVKDKFDRNNFLYFYLHRFSDFRAFNKLIKESSQNAIDPLVEGIGGLKNILSLKKTNNSLIFVIKSDYLLKKDILETCGSTGIRYEDDKVIAIFYYLEIPLLFKKLKSLILENRRELTDLDLD